MATKKGITTAKAAFLISYLSISSVVGKIFFGLLFHFCQIQVHRATAFSMLCIGISNCLVPFGDGYIVMCLYAVSCGIFEGCISGQIVMIVLGTVGSTKMAQGLANLFTINAVFMMTGPAVTGEYHNNLILIKRLCQMEKDTIYLFEEIIYRIFNLHQVWIMV